MSYSIHRIKRLGLAVGCSMRRMSSSYGDGTTPWYQSILDVFTANSATGYIWSHDSGISTAVEQPVQTWSDVTNTVSLTQSGVSTLRPTRKSDGVMFDGVDDRMVSDTLAGLAEGSHTILLGFDNPDNITTSVRTVVAYANALSSGFLRQVIINYSNPSSPNATRQRYYLADAATTASVSNMDISTIGAGPYDLAYRNVGLNGNARVDTLTSPLVQSGLVVTRPANVETFTLFTVGARRNGAGPTTSQFWEGKIRYIVICNKYLSDLDLATCLSALQSRGLA